MSVFPCGRCGQRVPGKLASVYWAWFDASGERQAWKELLCAPCVGTALRELLRKSQEASPNVAQCPACGSDSSADMDPIYATVYMPKMEPLELQLVTDAACAAKLRIPIVDSGRKLPNRRENEGPQAPHANPWSEVLA